MKKLDEEVLLIVDEGREHEAVTRLARVGIDNTIGFLNGGIMLGKMRGIKQKRFILLTLCSLNRNKYRVKYH